MLGGRLIKHIRTILTAFALAAGLPAVAVATVDGWPAMHDVAHVTADDVLNIRSAPDARADIIGTFAHDATDIEIIRPDETYEWGLVNIREGRGWVSLRYMDRHPGQSDGVYPEFAFCAGTEPFWSLYRKDGYARLKMALNERRETTETILWETGTLNHRHRYSFATSSMVGVVSRAYCDDGMSENEYGLELNLVLPGEELHLRGCCSLEPRGN